MVLNNTLHLRYLAGFWICVDFRMHQSFEYIRVLNKSGLHKILNKVFLDRCLAVLWIRFGFWICHGSKYTRVHKVVNKFFHQGSEYASSSEYTSVTQGSVENSPSCMFDRLLSIPWAINILGLKYTRVVHMPKFRLVFSRFLGLRGNLGIVKEKSTRKTCFYREKKCLAPRIYQAKFCLAVFLWSQRNLYYIFRRNRCSNGRESIFEKV